MVVLSEFVMSPFAEEFQPAGLKDSAQFLGPPPGLDTIAIPSDCNTWSQNSKKALYPPGLPALSVQANTFDAPPGLRCPPGLDAPVPITEETAIQSFDFNPEDSKRLTEDKLRCSNQFLEIESMRLLQQNELLRTKISSKGHGPPGVWQPRAWTSTDPWSAWTREYQATLGQWDLAQTKDEDECSEVSDRSTVDLSGSEDTEDSADSSTASAKIEAFDASSDLGIILSSSSSPRSPSTISPEHCPRPKSHE